MKIDKLNSRFVLTAREVAELLDVSTSHVYESVRRGDLPSHRMGRRIVIPARPIVRILGLDETATPSDGEHGGA